MAELLQKLPENCLAILCEAEQTLYDFSETEGCLKTTDGGVLKIPPEKLSELPIEIYNLAKFGLYKRVIRLDFSAGIQFNSDFYNRLFSACSESLMTFWKNRITLTKFGRRYSKNLFENLHYLFGYTEGDISDIIPELESYDVRVDKSKMTGSLNIFMDYLFPDYYAENCSSYELTVETDTKVVVMSLSKNLHFTNLGLEDKDEDILGTLEDHLVSFLIEYSKNNT